MKEQFKEVTSLVLVAESSVLWQYLSHCFFAGCATTVLVTGAGIGEMVLQLLVGSVSVGKGKRQGMPKTEWNF